MNNLVSIIIPCYNTEFTLEETLQSVINQNYDNWEAVMVNDGSKDNLEQVALEYTKKDKRFIYFKKENGGLGSARNFGIQKAKGQFILPLDSDNKMRPNFLKDAIKIFNDNPELGIVYGDVQNFGEKNNRIKVGNLDEYKILIDNYIDAFALIKKITFDKVGLYDIKMPFQGHEDWDFWINCIQNNINFYYLEEIALDYRVVKSSMINSFSEEMHLKNIHYLQDKYFQLYRTFYLHLYFFSKKLELESINTIKTVDLISLVLKRIKKILWKA
jgi:glycosyltransferase involved in cell wall biosynthesis